MAYDEGLAQRLRDLLIDERGVSEKRMFGGLCLLVDGKMAAGIVGDELMARVGADGYAAALRKPGARVMDFTGKPLKGFVFVGVEGIESERSLEEWVMAGVATARAEAKKSSGKGARARARRKR